MQPIEILKDLHFVERGYLNGNHFVYISAPPVLIDSGYVADVDETVRIIKNLGVNLSEISQILCTHSHCDHIGGNHYIQQKSNCDIALHKIGKHFIDTRDDWSTWWRYYQQDADFFDCTIELTDGDMIAIGPHEFSVIHTPGHASDGIVLYNRKNKVLISSDTLWENDVAVMTLRVEGSTALFRMMETYDRIESLDVQMVYPGHGEPFPDFGGALSKSRKKIERLIANRELVGLDLLKKITVYTLLMRKAVPENDFFNLLMGTYWFKETVDLYFNSEYETKFDEIMRHFLQRKIIQREEGMLITTVKP